MHPPARSAGPRASGGALPLLSAVRGAVGPACGAPTEGGTREAGTVDGMAPRRRLELVLLCVYVVFENRHVMLFSVVEAFLMPR